ncbi:preprotein translocase subunit SecY [Candidatus Shapirobacteria bacterium]|nr:preprotein translocase subunit SecY [Candidatus Shapirobacteria bacterium]
MFKKLLNVFSSCWRIKDIRKRLLSTLGFLVGLRFLAHIPLPGVNREILKTIFSGNQFLGLLNIFSGGTLANFSITALGLAPYINASIIFQLLSFMFPYFERLTREGEAGRQKIERYTKIASLPLAIFQSLGMYALFKNQGVIGSLPPVLLISLVTSLTAGTFILIWLGNLISEYGIGNGISLLIFAGIISQLPQDFAQTIAVASQGGNWLNFFLFLVLSLAVIGGIIFVNEGVRRLLVHYARRVQGRKMYGGGVAYLPLRLNQAGVIPIIFAVSVVLLPSMIGQFLGQVQNEGVRNFALGLAAVFQPEGVTYNLVYFILVVAFTFFYTMIVFDPEKIAKTIQKNGGFIPGVRPGKATANYLGYLSLRLTLPGAIFLGLVAILPVLIKKLTGIGTIALGGTGTLIVVSVVLETAKTLEGMMEARGYEKFLENY